MGHELQLPQCWIFLIKDIKSIIGLVALEATNKA